MNSGAERKNSARRLVGLLAMGLALAGSAVAFDNLKASTDRPERVRIEVDSTPAKRDVQLTTSFSDVVKKVSPSVVRVYTTTKMQGAANPMAPFLDDPMFRRFFGEPGGQSPRRGPAPSRQGLGSGVIITPDGYILTNNHVVDGADEVKVLVGESEVEHTAKVVGKDPKTDVAVLKIESDKTLPHITVADSDLIEVGDVVLAVGNPFGIGQTVTMGIVSALGRATLGMDYEDFIQTDAAINPGNSGGALVDTHGRLLGINTAILSRSGGNQGIGFAIPVNLARSVMESLVEHGRVVRGYLGVMIQDVTPALAKEFNVENSEGALVGDVTPDSPAAKAGVKPGDVIVEFDGKKVKDSRNLKLMAGQTAPGREVAVKLLREGKGKELKLALKELPSDQLAGGGKGAGSSGDTLDGVTVGNIDAATRRELKLPRGFEGGALVTQIDPESNCFRAGLREGDVILEINRKPVGDADEAVALSDGLKDESVLLRVWSRGGIRYIVVRNGGLG